MNSIDWIALDVAMSRDLYDVNLVIFRDIVNLLPNNFLDVYIWIYFPELPSISQCIQLGLFRNILSIFLPKLSSISQCPVIHIIYRQCCFENFLMSFLKSNNVFDVQFYVLLPEFLSISQWPLTHIIYISCCSKNFFISFLKYNNFLGV